MVVASRMRSTLTAGRCGLKAAPGRAAGPRTGMRCFASRPGDQPAANRGFGLLEWTGKLVPQGLIVTGAKESWKLGWQTLMRELAPQDRSGSYVRQAYTFTTPESEIKAEPGRYHLYLGNACPWCHRVLLAYALRGFTQSTLSITQLGSDPTKARRGGWIFTAQQPDPVWGAQDLWEVYDKVRPGWTGRCTAPVLVDKKEKKIISNESVDIVRLLDSDALHLPGSCTAVRLRPSSAEDPTGQLATSIDKLCDQIYVNVNNGVYVSGFSTSQVAYDQAQQRLFDMLDQLEARLAQTRFLMGDKLTQADVWLFPTISRFDAIYSGIFRCCRKLIRIDYPNLDAWLRDMWQLQLPATSATATTAAASATTPAATSTTVPVPASATVTYGGSGMGASSNLQIRATIDIDAARASYYTSLFPLNPSGIVPSGPTAKDLRLERPAGRGGPNTLLGACLVRGQKLPATADI